MHFYKKRKINIKHIFCYLLKLSTSSVVKYVIAFPDSPALPVRPNETWQREGKKKTI